MTLIKEQYFIAYINVIITHRNTLLCRCSMSSNIYNYSTNAMHTFYLYILMTCLTLKMYFVVKDIFVII